jgi:hypothetical protein
MARRFFFPLAVLLLAAPSLHACVGCSEGVTVGKHRAGEVLAGFSLSVLFLLGAVAVVIGSLAALTKRAVARIEAERIRTDRDRR